MSGHRQSPTSLEVFIGGATVLLSTTAYLLGSPKLAVIALVAGGISFGIALGARGSRFG